MPYSEHLNISSQAVSKRPGTTVPRHDQRVASNVASNPVLLVHIDVVKPAAPHRGHSQTPPLWQHKAGPCKSKGHAPGPLTGDGRIYDKGALWRECDDVLQGR